MKKNIILKFGDFKIPFSYKNQSLKPKGICSELSPIHIHESTSFDDISVDLYNKIEDKKRLFGPDFKKRQDYNANMKRLMDLQAQLRRQKGQEAKEKREKEQDAKRLEAMRLKLLEEKSEREAQKKAERENLQLLKGAKYVPKGKIGKMINK